MFKVFPAPDAKGDLINFLDVTNLAEATYYREVLYGQTMCGMRHFSITGTVSATTGDSTNTITVEITNDEDLVNATWVPVYGYEAYTNTTVNSVASSGAAVLFAWFFDFLNVYALRVKVVCGDATNTIIIKGRLST
jgi:hypothetical protein